MINDDISAGVELEIKRRNLIKGYLGNQEVIWELMDFYSLFHWSLNS